MRWWRYTDVSILPTLHVSDIPRQAPNKDTKVERKSVGLAQRKNQHHQQQQQQVAAVEAVLHVSAQ